jgi:predicted RNA polymerase sigma factor
VRIAALYQVPAYVMPSPVVGLNRAVAVGKAYGPAKALAIIESLTAERARARYPQLPAVRGDLLVRLGRADQARREFQRAATLTRNARERALFLARADACAETAEDDAGRGGRGLGATWRNAPRDRSKSSKVLNTKTSS